MCSLITLSRDFYGFRWITEWTVHNALFLTRHIVIASSIFGELAHRNCMEDGEDTENTTRKNYAQSIRFQQAQLYYTYQSLL